MNYHVKLDLPRIEDKTHHIKLRNPMYKLNEPLMDLDQVQPRKLQINLPLSLSQGVSQLTDKENE